MAVWQADFQVLLPVQDLPADYRQALAQLLPPAKSWSTQLEVWGTEAGDRIDVFSEDNVPVEMFARFDLRAWNAPLYERFLAFVSAVGARLQSDTGMAISVTPDPFRQALLGSRAAAFVRDPEAYIRDLRDHPIRMPDEP